MIEVIRNQVLLTVRVTTVLLLLIFAGSIHAEINIDGTVKAGSQDNILVT